MTTIPFSCNYSMALCESHVGTSSGDPRCDFDLDDPVHVSARRCSCYPHTTALSSYSTQFRLLPNTAAAAAPIAT